MLTVWFVPALAGQSKPAPAPSTDTVPVAPVADTLVAATTAADADRVEAVADVPVHATPSGAPVATLRGGTPVRIIGRADGWTRVQLEGWVRDTALRPGSGAALTGVTAAEVRATPDQYVGRAVDWMVQLIAVQKADDLRPEMSPGQPYLLARGPLPESGFVYITLTAKQADEMRALPPLQELLARVRIRAARSRYLETPVADLLTVVKP